jgi:hypothetical protein
LFENRHSRNGLARSLIKRTMQEELWAKGLSS